ncbi:hypothetical protein SNE40_001531 [Patella caerulea]|uniref:Uncharacterized protein n=1 Tax=Patella caerulea TaxID=87958 RepID=A0AAN8KNY8_PATCE
MDIIFQEPEVSNEIEIESSNCSTKFTKSATESSKSDRESPTSPGAEEPSSASEASVLKYPEILKCGGKIFERGNITLGSNLLSSKSEKFVARKVIKRPESKCMFSCHNVIEKSQGNYLKGIYLMSSEFNLVDTNMNPWGL